MNFKLPLLLLLFYNINRAHCNNYYRSSKLLAPPPRAQLQVQNQRNHLQRKHETSPRNFKSVQKPVKSGVKKAEGGILTSLVNSVISLFPFGNKKLSVKVVRSKSQKVIKSKQFVKRLPKKPLLPVKYPKLPHKKIPIQLKPQKSHRIRKPSSHVKNIKLPVAQAASDSVNENSLPNKRQIKQLVVELHKTVVEDILQKQSSNRSSSNSSSRVINPSGLRNIAPVVTSIGDKPPQTADQAPPPQGSQHHAAERSPVRSSGSSSSPNHPKSDKVKRLVNNMNKRYQTSFSTNSLEMMKDGDTKDELEFKPFVPNFLLLEAGSESKESDPSSVMSKESEIVKDSSDADRPSLRSSNEGVEIIETGDHTDTEGCSDPVAGCYEKILDAKILQLQREMDRLEERYWGNRV